MIERTLELVLNESKWLTTAMLLSFIAVLALIIRQRRQSLPYRRKILAAMNLFYGGMIGIMACGHLLAVTIKVIQGTLTGSLWILYPLGLALAIPAWWLVLRVAQFGEEEERGKKRIVALNAGLGISLLALGFHNWPLAAPAAWNIAYQFHSKRTVGWAIVSVALIATLALFTGSLVFFLSGQSFEQFKGM
ncbi:MAG: hypothetical protein AAB354_03705 [candidate division KSB1 bacterium]